MPYSRNPRPTYKPGFRAGTTKYGQVSENQVGWVETHLGKVALLSLPWDSESKESEINVGPNVQLCFPPGRPKLMLTNLTVEELNKLKEMIDLAFELALPVAAERDRIADVATREGDDSNYRSYRRAPKLVVREGPLDKHKQGVLFGSDSVPGSNGSSDGDGERVRGASPVVAAVEEEQGGSFDDDEETGQPESLG